LHPASVNTIRIYAPKTEADLVHNAAVLRVSASGNFVNDTWPGGFFVGGDLQTSALQRLAARSGGHVTSQAPSALIPGA
jgi:hypothetical protein